MSTASRSAAVNRLISRRPWRRCSWAFVGSLLSQHADVFVYSGYTLSVIKRRYARMLDLADALMTGPFVASRPTNLSWRGSANQVSDLLKRTSSGEVSEPLLLTYESRSALTAEKCG